MKKEEETLAIKEDENREERSKQEEAKHDVAVDLGQEENVVKHEDSPAHEDLQTLQV